MSDQAPVIDVKNLVIEYGKGKNTFRAVDDITFRVNPGECVGFIGANGAGKSSTIKTLMGFMFPTSGSVSLYGQSPTVVASRAQIGYLPEVALYYPFMKARELLELYGGLQGLSKSELKKRIPAMLDKVGLGEKSESLLKTFSKGMQQRLGIAQALLADPETIIFDELTSGLDPLGRYDLRQVLLEIKNAGRTLFFSSHELSEVEALCDRVVMIHKGRIVSEALVSDLMKPLNVYEITFQSRNGSKLPEQIEQFAPSRENDRWHLRVDDIDRYSRALEEVRNAGFQIHETASRTQSLEEYFISLVQETNAANN